MKSIKLVSAFIISCFLLCMSVRLSAQFTFAHISDIHVADGNPEGYFGGYDMNGAQFNCTIKHLRNLYPRPAFVVASGDISNVGGIPPDGMYTALTRHLFPRPYNDPRPGDYFIDLAQDIPIYFAPGNHEYYRIMVPPFMLSSPEYYVKYISPDEDYAIYKDNAIIISLRTGGDTPYWEGQNPFDALATGLTDDQCNWLRETLNNAGNKRKIIFMHHPVRNSSGINYSDSASHAVPANEGTFANNRITFMDICDAYQVDVVLIGHTHNSVVLNRGGYIVDENWSGETRYVQTAAEIDGFYRIITVNESFVNVSQTLHVECTTSDQPVSKVSVELYPSPMTTLAILSLKMDENIINYETRIYTAQGLEVRHITGINSSETIIERGNLKPGVYFYKVCNNQGLVKGSGKFSVMDK